MKFKKLVKLVINMAKKIIYLRNKDTWKSINSCDILFFCGDNNRAETFKGKAYSRQLDTIYDDLTSKGFSCTHLAYPYSLLTGETSWGTPLSYNRYFFKSEIKKLLVITLSRIGFNNIIDNNLEEELYEYLINKANPKCVFTVGVDSTLCEICRNKNIPIVEILHAYGFEEVPWGLEEKSFNLLPTHIVSFDDRSTDTFKVLEKKGVKIIQTNDIWHDKFIECNLPIELNKKVNKEKDSKKILICTSWGYDNEKSSLNEFSGILENGYLPNELIKVINESEDTLLWCLRLHPRHLRSAHRFPKLYDILNQLEKNNKNFEWKLSSKLPLPHLLKVVEGHITMISGTAYEASAYGIQTLFLCPTLLNVNKKYYSHLIENGFATVGDYKDSKSIKDWVENIKKLDKKFTQHKSVHWNEFVNNILNLKSSL